MEKLTRLTCSPLLDFRKSPDQPAGVEANADGRFLALPASTSRTRSRWRSAAPATSAPDGSR